MQYRRLEHLLQELSAFQWADRGRDQDTLRQFVNHTAMQLDWTKSQLLREWYYKWQHKFAEVVGDGQERVYDGMSQPDATYREFNDLDSFLAALREVAPELPVEEWRQQGRRNVTDAAIYRHIKMADFRERYGPAIRWLYEVVMEDKNEPTGSYVTTENEASHFYTKPLD